jgi:hypothetical protein
MTMFTKQGFERKLVSNHKIWRDILINDLMNAEAVQAGTQYGLPTIRGEIEAAPESDMPSYYV